MFSSNACPQCLCRSVHKSRRRFYDLPMLAFGFKAARCASCGIRFYRVPAKFRRAQSVV